jgi:hypothetical protein
MSFLRTHACARRLLDEGLSRVCSLPLPASAQRIRLCHGKPCVDDGFDDNVGDIWRYLANYCSLWKRRIGLYIRLLQTG